MAEAVRASLMLLSLLKRGTPVWPSCMASHWLGGHPLTQSSCLCLGLLAASCQIHTETGLHLSN